MPTNVKYKSPLAAAAGVVILAWLAVWTTGCVEPQSNPSTATSGSYIRVFSARVTRVADGDTLNCLEDGNEVRVRLFGIDAPEYRQNGDDESRDYLKDLVENRDVEIRVVDVDQYERLVARIVVTNEDGQSQAAETDVNHAMIEAGWAWWYRTYAPDERDFAEAEEAAKNARCGIWREDNPLPPWEFRRRSREN